MRYTYLLDQSLSWRVGRDLEAAGYDVEHTNEVGLQDAPDARVLDYSSTHGRILITRDGDFAKMMSSSPQAPLEWSARERSVVELVQDKARGLATPQEQSAALLRHLPAVERELHRGVVVQIDRGGISTKALERNRGGAQRGYSPVRPGRAEREHHTWERHV